jgi:hypothetical protein
MEKVWAKGEDFLKDWEKEEVRVRSKRVVNNVLMFAGLYKGKE